MYDKITEINMSLISKIFDKKNGREKKNKNITFYLLSSKTFIVIYNFSKYAIP